MRRDMELIRKLLLFIEEHGGDLSSWIDNTIVDGYTKEAISYHIWLLRDAGLIDAVQPGPNKSGAYLRPRCLTWLGHEFLNTVRDRDIWEKTLEVAEKVGTNSFSALWDIAKKLVAEKLGELILSDPRNPLPHPAGPASAGVGCAALAW